jgi:hypothetical protein
MKNIHILPTDKPSRIGYYTDPKDTQLYILSNGNKIGDYKPNWKPQNIYITSDEEIKEGNWVYYENGDLKGIHKVVNGQRPKTMILKKIILTTDSQLIANGVQAIDDEFLEWFCSKNGEVYFVEVITIEDEEN